MSAAYPSGLEPALQAKANCLFDLIAKMDALIVAYSGGVDSSLLCAVGHHLLGDRFLAVTVHSPVETPGDHQTAVALANQLGFRHLLVEFDDLENPQFVANPPERCYHCKLARFQQIQVIAEQQRQNWGAPRVVIAEGSNADDAFDYRPGSRAVAELGIRSPLAEAGLTKAEIRAISKAMGLATWDRPSAPCLATRFPYGTPVTLKGLGQVAEGESFLRERGFLPSRVRHYGQTARLEVPTEHIEHLIAMRNDVLIFFKSIGFTYVVLDLAGYRMGSMNEVLKS